MRFATYRLDAWADSHSLTVSPYLISGQVVSPRYQRCGRRAICAIPFDTRSLVLDLSDQFPGWTAGKMTVTLAAPSEVTNFMAFASSENVPVAPSFNTQDIVCGESLFVFDDMAAVCNRLSVSRHGHGAPNFLGKGWTGCQCHHYRQCCVS